MCGSVYENTSRTDDFLVRFILSSFCVGAMGPIYMLPLQKGRTVALL